MPINLFPIEILEVKDVNKRVYTSLKREWKGISVSVRLILSSMLLPQKFCNVTTLFCHLSTAFIFYGLFSVYFLCRFTNTYSAFKPLFSHLLWVCTVLILRRTHCSVHQMMRLKFCEEVTWGSGRPCQSGRARPRLGASSASASSSPALTSLHPLSLGGSRRSCGRHRTFSLSLHALFQPTDHW